MSNLALGAFFIAAVIGAFVAVRHLRRKPVPISVALIHGAFALAGLGFLVALLLQGSTDLSLILALLLFSLAALDGLVLLLVYHLRGEPLPVVLIAIHILLALTALMILLLSGA